jgi:hypothetical protein
MTPDAASSTMGSLWADLGIVAAVLVSLSVLAGLATRYVLVPYLRDHLVRPVQETHRQVTQNRHANVEPTVLDRIDDVHDAVRRVADTMVAVQAVANAAARSSSGAHRRLDQHSAWADVEVSRIWSSIHDPQPVHRARDEDREDPPL